MSSSLSPEQDALTQMEMAGSQLSLPGSNAQFVATNQGPAALKWALPDGTMGDASTSAVISLLERGLHCFRQKRYQEGIPFFAQARPWLLSEQGQLAALLDTVMQNGETYWQAQQALDQARQRLAAIDAGLGYFLSRWWIIQSSLLAA